MEKGKKCFYHPDRNATVSCFQCHKALCPECVLEAPGGSFCSKLCSEKYQDYRAGYSDTKKKVQKVKHRRGLLGRIIVAVVVIAAVYMILKVGAALGIGIFQKIVNVLPF
jgi:hypothetical protein